MTSNSHARGSEGSHNELEEDVKAIGIKRSMGQEIFDKQVAEIRESLSKIMKLLQESSEDQFFEWILRTNKIQWPRLHKRLQQRRVSWLKEEFIKPEHE